MITKKIICCGVLAWGLVHGTSPAIGKPREVICKGTVGTLVVGHVRVPRGHTCHLRGTQVRGNVIVEPRATLRSSGSKIGGNVRVHQDHRLNLDSSTRVRGKIISVPTFR